MGDFAPVHDFGSNGQIQARLRAALLPPPEYSILSRRAFELRQNMIVDLAEGLEGTRTSEQAAGAWMAATIGNEDELNHYFHRVWKALDVPRSFERDIDREYDDPDERDFERYIPRSAGQIIRWILWPTVGGLPWTHIGIYALILISLGGAILRQTVPFLATMLTDAAAVLTFYALLFSIIGSALLAIIIGISDSILAMIKLDLEAIPAEIRTARMCVRILRDHRYNPRALSNVPQQTRILIGAFIVSMLFVGAVTSAMLFLMVAILPVLLVALLPVALVAITYLLYNFLLIAVRKTILVPKAQTANA